jgi:hypothetical protein
MRLKIEIKVEWVNNVCVHHCAWTTVAGPVSVLVHRGEKPCVMALLDDDEREGGIVAILKTFACSPKGFDFSLEDDTELTLGNTIPVEEDSFGF